LSIKVKTLPENKYALIVVDIDGTLIGEKRVISRRDKAAIKKAAEKGIKVSLCTGRVNRACLKIIEELGLDGYHIFYDGALVSDLSGTKELYARAIDKGMVRRMVEFVSLNDTYLELYSSRHFFAERKNWSDEIHSRFFGVAPEIISYEGIWDRERVIKAELVVRSKEEAIKADRFKKEFGSDLRFSIARSPSFPDIEFINILNPEASKGEALAALAAHLGVRLEEVMAIGDGSNDVPLFEMAGFTVAMANARDELKKIADYITLDADSSGVAVAVEKFLF
jgi:5-amino-6-(5-phospho-D-ribitylamino)uracil phosphatase